MSSKQYTFLKFNSIEQIHFRWYWNMPIIVFLPSCLRHGVSFIIFRTFSVAIWTFAKTDKVTNSDDKLQYFRMMPKYVTDHSKQTVSLGAETHGVSCYCTTCTNNELILARKCIETYWASCKTNHIVDIIDKYEKTNF